jgi:hypothetical protein
MAVVLNALPSTRSRRGYLQPAMAGRQARQARWLSLPTKLGNGGGSLWHVRAERRRRRRRRCGAKWGV